MVVLVLNNIGEVVFWMGILVAFEVFEITSYTMGGDTIPGGYTTEFQIIEVGVNSGVEDII